jgi:hypothetical protein
MAEYDLGNIDVLTAYSLISCLKTLNGLGGRLLGKHLVSGGVLLIEPGSLPKAWKPGSVMPAGRRTGEDRAPLHQQNGWAPLLFDMHYLVAARRYAALSNATSWAC